MTDVTNHHGAGAWPEPSDELLTKAAQVLGVADLFEHTRVPTRRLVMVTVAGPAGRKVLQVPLDVPMRQLAAGLGSEVGAPVVAGVTLHGERVAPSRTLGELGARAGSLLVISSPDAPPADWQASYSPPPPRPRRPPDERLHRDPRQRDPRQSGPNQSGPRQRGPHQRGPHRVDGPSRSRRRWIVPLIGAPALIAVSLFVGAAVLGRLWPGASATPAASQALARRAALSWLAGGNPTGARRSSTQATLTRDGKPIAGSLEAVAFSTRQDITEGLFIADPTGGRPFGLSIVIVNGMLAYPPSVTGLPFATSVPPGSEPFVPESGRSVAPSLTAAAQRWAKRTFPPAGLTSLSLTVAGKVKVLNQWKPRAGPSMVARISVPLTAALPRHAGSTRFTSVYDVTFTSAGNPIGWAPADYKIGGNS